MKFGFILPSLACPLVTSMCTNVSFGSLKNVFVITICFRMQKLAAMSPVSFFVPNPYSRTAFSLRSWANFAFMFSSKCQYLFYIFIEFFSLSFSFASCDGAYKCIMFTSTVVCRNLYHNYTIWLGYEIFDGLSHTVRDNYSYSVSLVCAVVHGVVYTAIVNCYFSRTEPFVVDIFIYRFYYMHLLCRDENRIRDLGLVLKPSKYVIDVTVGVSQSLWKELGVGWWSLGLHFGRKFFLFLVTLIFEPGSTGLKSVPVLWCHYRWK